MTATHSITSTYFGSITMVLKFPLTRAASAKGLHRYNGFCTETDGEGGAGGGGFVLSGGNVAEVGVGDRFVLLGPVLFVRLAVPKDSQDAQNDE